MALPGDAADAEGERQVEDQQKDDLTQDGARGEVAVAVDERVDGKGAKDTEDRPGGADGRRQRGAANTISTEPARPAMK